jgi:Zn-dependent M28 family amino/carboxypeptidase
MPNPARFAKIINPASLEKKLSVVAGADMEGRNTPSAGLDRAANYIESQFKSFGLQPGNNGSYRLYFDLEKDSITSLALNMDGTGFTPWTDFAPVNPIPANANLNFSEYIFVGYGIVDENRDDYKNTDVKGKLVIFFAGAPEGFTSTKTRRESPVFIGNKIANAKRKGAAAALIIVDSLPSQRAFNNMYRPKPDTVRAHANDIIPVFMINDNIVSQSGQSISELKASIGKDVIDPIEKQIEINMECISVKAIKKVSNVIGIVEGSDKKDEYLLVTGHYDHLGMNDKGQIFYGADDDGSGTVSVMAMAEAFASAKKAGKGPRRNVVFMTVCGEEKGLWGSAYYSEHPVFPLSKTTADLNIDMDGRIDTERQTGDTLNYVYVIGHDKLSTDLQQINEEMNNKYTKLTLDYRFDDPKDPNRIYYRSDHYNFAKKGVPILFFYDGMLKADYHKITDTIDKINFSLMAKRAQMVFYTAWNIANRADMLKRDLKLNQ